MTRSLCGWNFALTMFKILEIIFYRRNALCAAACTGGSHLFWSGKTATILPKIVFFWQSWKYYSERSTNFLQTFLNMVIILFLH